MDSQANSSVRRFSKIGFCITQPIRSNPSLMVNGRDSPLEQSLVYQMSQSWSADLGSVQPFISHLIRIHGQEGLILDQHSMGLFVNKGPDLKPVETYPNPNFNNYCI